MEAGTGTADFPVLPSTRASIPASMKTSLLVLASIGLVLVGTAAYYLRFGGEPTANFKTVPLKRGDLAITITATGTLEPEDRPDVGAQVTGKIMAFRDPTDSTSPEVDYNSPVKKGQVIAMIDPAVYQSTYDQAKASLDRANADLLQLIAKRDQSEAEWTRAQKLHDLKFSSLSLTDSRQGGASSTSIKGISDSDYDLAKANFEVAKANAEIGKAVIAQAEAALKQAKINLDYCTIRSPIDGQVIERRVEIGQTVVSNLSASSLFLLATDLHKLQVWASVNEADIGKIKPGMDVVFDCDTYQGEDFHGTVSQVRLNATQNQNVVLYTVIISVENPELKLLPYLTANVHFQVNQRNGVLMVPNAALMWQPKPNQIAPDTEQPSPSAAGVAASGGAKGGERRKDGSEKGQRGQAQHVEGRPSHATIWVKDDHYVRPIDVEVGASDGLSTEVSGPDLSEGLDVVISEIREDRMTDAKNPFAPQFFRGGGGRGGPGGGGGGGGIRGALRGA
jgi:HlyD family secretion protein